MSLNSCEKFLVESIFESTHFCYKGTRDVKFLAVRVLFSDRVNTNKPLPIRKLLRSSFELSFSFPLQLCRKRENPRLFVPSKGGKKTFTFDILVSHLRTVGMIAQFIGEWNHPCRRKSIGREKLLITRLSSFLPLLRSPLLAHISTVSQPVSRLKGGINTRKYNFYDDIHSFI